MKEQDKERLIKHIDFLKEEIKEIDKFLLVDWKRYQTDKDMRRNIERWIENIVNCSIDIAKILLVMYKKPIPETYKETLYNIFHIHDFDEKFGEELSKYAKLRNILSHEYLDMKWERIKDFIENSKPIYDKLINKVEELLIKNLKEID